MIAHHVLTMAFICYIAFNWRRRYSSTVAGVIEIGSEFMLHLASVLLSICGDKQYGKEVQESVQTLFFLVVGTLVAVNVANTIRITV